MTFDFDATYDRFADDVATAEYAETAAKMFVEQSLEKADLEFSFDETLDIRETVIEVMVSAYAEAVTSLLKKQSST